MRRHASPDHPPAERLDRDEERVLGVGRGGARGQHEVGRLGAPGEAPDRRLDRVGIVLDVDDVEDLRPETLDLGPHRRLEPLLRRRPDRLLHDDADAPRDERRDRHDRLAAEPGDPRTGLDHAGIDEVRRDLDARDEVAALDDLTVEDREHLERVEPVDPFELGDPHGDDAIDRRDQVEPALVRAADVEPGPGDRLGQPQRGLVLVQLVAARRPARVTGGPGSSAASASRSSSDSRRPFDQRFPPTVRSRVRIAPASRPGRAPARDDPLDAQRSDAGSDAR